MRRNWLWLTGAKKDTKLNYKGRYERMTDGVHFEFFMLQGAAEKATHKSFDAILKGLNTTAIFVFNMGMWDLRAVI